MKLENIEAWIKGKPEYTVTKSGKKKKEREFHRYSCFLRLVILTLLKLAKE
jgi:hypothetical protein